MIDSASKRSNVPASPSPATTPYLSVVIVTHNVRALLQSCLESVFGSEAPWAFEITVVDTGLDGSGVVVARDFPLAQVILAPENPGYAAANNLGLRRARGRYCLLLNPDTVLPPDALRRTVETLEQHPEVGILGPKLIRGDGSLDLACRRSFPTPRIALYHFLRLPKLFPTNTSFGAYNLTYRDPDEEYEVDAVVGAFLLTRREVLNQIGLLDETFWMYGEDLDFCWRARQAGWKTRYVPSVRVVHLKGQSSRARSLRCTYEFFRAMHVFYAKHQAHGAPAAQNALVTAGIVTIGALSLAADRLRLPAMRRVS